jgi:hypothetical protein
VFISYRNLLLPAVFMFIIVFLKWYTAHYVSISTM